jgi:hypothetical protein
MNMWHTLFQVRVVTTSRLVIILDVNASKNKYKVSNEQAPDNQTSVASPQFNTGGD